MLCSRLSSVLRLKHTYLPLVLSGRYSTAAMHLKRYDKVDSTQDLKRIVSSQGTFSALMKPIDKENKFDSMWKSVISSGDIDLFNHYLNVRVDSGSPVDFDRALSELKEANLRPNIGTYGAFIHQSCMAGDMEQTNAYLKALHEAGLQPNLYIFSQILHGYLKAGYPEEVIATQELMTQLGLWPSRLGYEGMLTAFAEMGDKTSLLETLNEACVTLSTRRLNSADNDISRIPFRPSLILQLYVKLFTCGSNPDSPCSELLDYLPAQLDDVVRRKILVAVKPLLAYGRPKAALEIFKRATPDTVDLSYIKSLVTYCIAGDLNPECLNDFFEIANVSGTRLTELKRFVESKSNDSLTFGKVQEIRLAVCDKDVGAIINTINELTPDTMQLAYNVAVPSLNKLGISLEQIIDQVQTPALRSAVAFGYLLEKLADKISSPNLIGIERYALKLRDQKLLPLNDVFYLRSATMTALFRNCLITSDGAPLESAKQCEQISKLFDIFSIAVEAEKLRLICLHLISSCFYLSNDPNSSHLFDQKKIGQHLVNICVKHEFYIPANHRIFSLLQHMNMDQESLRKLRNIKPADYRTQTQYDTVVDSTVVVDKLRTLIRNGNLKEAIYFIRQNLLYKNTDQHLFKKMNHNLMNWDPFKLACELFDKNTANQIKLEDLEELLYTLLDAYLVHDPSTAINRLATYYTEPKNINAFGDFFKRAQDRLGTRNHILFSHNVLTSFLKTNPKKHWDILFQSLQNEFLSDISFAVAAHILVRILSSTPELSELKTEVGDAFPVQALSARLSGCSPSSQKDRIHFTIEQLLKRNHLWTAQSLHMWTIQSGLTISPRLNERLLLAPYFSRFLNRVDYDANLLTHLVTKHWPVNFDQQLFNKFDRLVLSVDTTTSEEHSLPNVNALANWLLKTVPNYSPNEMRNLNLIPTWLVICQRLCQFGSPYKQASNWTRLALEWFDQADQQSLEMSDSFKNWLMFAPSQRYENALLTACMAHSRGQSCAIAELREKSENFYSIITGNYLDCLTEAERDVFFDSVSKFGKAEVLGISRSLSTDLNNPSTFMHLISKLPEEDRVFELGNLCSAQMRWLPTFTSFLHQHCPDLKMKFFNYLIHTESMKYQSRDRFIKKIMSQFEMDPTHLEPANQAFLIARAFDKPSYITKRLSLLLPRNLSGADWFKESNDLRRIELLRKLDKDTLTQSAPFVFYNLNPSDDMRLNEFFFSLAEQRDATFLRLFAPLARPFTKYKLSEAFGDLAKCFDGERLNWIARAGIRYHHLGPFLDKPRTSSSIEKPLVSKENLILMTKKPVTTYVETLLQTLNDPEQLEKLVEQIISDPSHKRKVLLLSCVTANGVTDLLKMILSRCPDDLKNDYAPLIAFASIIKAQMNPSDKSLSEVDKVIKQLLNEPSDRLYTCLSGAHVEILFRCWPESHLKDLIHLVQTATKGERSITTIHLAAILINRGHKEYVTDLIKSAGPIPFTFMAGSPRHFLTPSSFRVTLDYLLEVDPEHVPGFVDTCLRNAAIASRNKDLNNLIDLIRMATSKPYYLDLTKICPPFTLQLISKVQMDIKHEFPSDVAQILAGCLKPRILESVRANS